MATVEELVAWAEAHAESLERGMTWVQADVGSGGYWEADAEAKGQVRARATAALDFLERVTGVDSRWSQDARFVLNNKGEQQSMETGVRGIAEVITEWVEQIRGGQLQPRMIEVTGMREVASTDLMEQVRVLNSDASVAPAAPIVLAGAALEMALRSAVEELGGRTSGRPGISSYAKTLRAAELLTRQDMKDIEQMAGLRNEAAHGHHDGLSTERAGLMEQQVNIFLRRLAAAIDQSVGHER